jgi:hypothetical protein
VSDNHLSVRRRVCLVYLPVAQGYPNPESIPGLLRFSQDDDTDIIDGQEPPTGADILKRLAKMRDAIIIRHQLSILVPYTSHNGSASIHRMQIREVAWPIQFDKQCTNGSLLEVIRDFVSPPTPPGK